MYTNKNSSSKIRNRSGLFVWFLALIVMAAIAVGDVEQGPIMAQAGESELVGTDTGGSEVDVSTNKTILSITFKKDMRIIDALRFLALKYNKNIVPSPKVDGQLAFTGAMPQAVIYYPFRVNVEARISSY